MVSRAAILALIVGCGGHAHVHRASRTSDDITLYRDIAIVRQRVVLDLPAGTTTAKVAIAASVPIDKVLVVDRGELQIAGVHSRLGLIVHQADGESETEETDNDASATNELDPGVEVPMSPDTPTEIHLDVVAPRAGRFAIQLAYTTDRLQWDAAYTMTATPARDRAVVRGAIAIRNTTGIALHAARVHVIDAMLGAWRGKTAEHLASAFVGAATSSMQPAAARDLGVLDVIEGETRVELLPSEAPRLMRSVLVYDPIGTKLDNQVTSPVPDRRLGVQPAAPTQITESFEVERDEATSIGLPAGPVRLLERRADGSLAVLGESRLFDAATRVADVDTIAVGTADAVVGHRERREYTYDEELHRLTEEFMITIDNHRALPAAVLVREHIYRGQNWKLAYWSAPAAKEGAQQIALRTSVPAKGQTKVLYVVVYTWGP
jgi:hypothetical protein